MLLLCSCATQRQAEKFFDKNPDKLAEYVDQQEQYTQEHGAAYAAKHFPPKFYPPAVHPKPTLVPYRTPTVPMLERLPALTLPPGFMDCPECKETYSIKTVYVEDTVRLDNLRMELNLERRARTALRQQLQETETERDYWKEQNRKKIWALIAMAIFALLYIIFKVLAARVRET